MKCKVLSVCPYLYLTLMGHTSVITIKLAFITFSNFENIPNESRIIDEINLQNRAWQKSGFIAKMTNKLMYHILYSLNCLKTWCPRVFLVWEIGLWSQSYDLRSLYDPNDTNMGLGDPLESYEYRSLRVAKMKTRNFG